MAVVLTGCTTGEPAPSAAPPGRQPLSMSPMGDAIYYCLVDRGWDVTITWDGGVAASSETIPDAQKQLYLADATECGQIVDDTQAALTDDDKTAMYEAELASRDCLIGRGYSVDEPPSLQVYLDTYLDGTWTALAASTAMTAAQTMSDSDWKALNVACPQPQWGLAP